MNLAWTLSVLGLAAAAVRLARLGLVKRYPFFFAYLILNVLSAGGLWMAGPTTTQSYLLVWESFEPFRQVLLMLSVAEVYGAITGQYPQIGGFAVWLLAGASVVALAACAGTAVPELGAVIFTGRVIRILFLTHRWLSTIAFGTITLVVLFLSFYKRPIAANVRRHAAVMMAYCGANAAAFLAINLWPERAIRWASVAELYISALCGVAWVLAFSKSGEFVKLANPSSIAELDDVRMEQHELLDETRGIQPLV